ELGRAVSLHWGFPEKLAEAIGAHHAESAVGLTEPRLTALTALGNQLAHWLRLPDHAEDEFLFSIPTWIYETLHIQPANLRPLKLACEAELHASPLHTLMR
ncbi:MAG: hypothetical protein NZL85_04245, partial [Fimbriimonadales bacterium]|nr:hypothetical protein [Fimbriimonadales bacterium]